jgi:hypothetical protein
VQLTSPLPAGLTPKGNSGDCSTDFPCVFPSIAPGASQTVTTGACVARDYTTPDPIVVTASVTADTADPNSGNDTGIANLPLFVEGFADGFDCP